MAAARVRWRRHSMRTTLALTAAWVVAHGCSLSANLGDLTEGAAGSPDASAGTGGGVGGSPTEGGAGTAGTAGEGGEAGGDSCSDGFRNGNETDIDCGGRCGSSCATGEACNTNADCADGFCQPTDGSCQPPTCSDGFLNQDESDVDCGGTICPPCGTCWGDASNFDFDDSALDFSANVSLDCSPTVDTSLDINSMLTGWCGAETPTPVIQTQSGGPDIVVIPMASFTLDAGQTLRLVGDKPVVLAIRGDATINGSIDAGARGTTPGAGGDDATDGAIATANQVPGNDCNGFPNGTGQGMDDDDRALGGGGAGLRTNGAFGGGERTNFRCYTGTADGYECKPWCPDNACDSSYDNSSDRFVANNSVHFAVTAVRGLQAPDQDLVPLRGGCAGGKGNHGGDDYFGGSGGGAVQITASGTLTIGAGGIISAGGGGGSIEGNEAGGSGGGSGGAILLEASAIDIDAADGIRAHGGGGAGRTCGISTAEDGASSGNVHATHPGCLGGGRGGIAFWNVANDACNGNDTTIASQNACTLPVPGWPGDTNAYPQAGGFTDNDGGGGGGGSSGIIRVRFLSMAGVCS